MDHFIIIPQIHHLVRLRLDFHIEPIVSRQNWFWIFLLLFNFFSTAQNGKLFSTFELRSLFIIETNKSRWTFQFQYDELSLLYVF